MKSSKLFLTSLLAAAAALSVPAFGATATLTSTTTTISESDAATYGIAAGTYSGNIIELTAAGSTGFHDGTFTIYNTDASGTISTTTGVVGTTSTALTNGGTAGAAQALWNYFVGSPSQLSSNYTYGETLYVSANTLSSGDLTANMTFGPAALGGLVVGASDNTFETGRTNGDIQMQFAGASGSGVVFNIASNTKLHAENGFVASGNQDWTIASGKTLSLLKKGDGGGTLTLNENCSMGVSGGGALSVGGIVVSSGATLTIGTDTTLDLSGARVTLGSAIANTGTVTLSGTTVFALDNLTATNGTYSLITGNSVTDVSGVSFTRDGSVIKSSRVSVSTTSGYAVTVTNYSDLAWAGTAENSAWNTTAENWSSTAAGGSVAFENRDSVTFGADAGVSKTVSVASVVVANSVAVSDSYEFAFSNNGSVTASTMSIADGKTLTLSGTGSLTTGAVSGGGNLTVGAGTEATFTAANTLSGSMTLDGTLNLNNSVLSVSRNTATISALSSLTGFSGSGRLVLDITGKGEATNVDFSPVSGFTGTLVVKGSSRMNLLGETDSLNAINQFAGIEVQSGAQLYLSPWTGQGTRVSNLSRTLTIAGAGYGGNANQAALRMSDGATLSGQLILSGNATVHSATGTQTISGGISAAGKTLTIAGSDTLDISGTANITIGTLTLTKSGDTNLSATGTTTIGTLNVATGTLNISGATLSGATALNFTAASGNVNFKKANGADSATYDIGAISFNNSDSTGRNMTIDEGVIVNAASLSAAYAFGTVTVNGALNLNGAISVKPGTTPNANTITGSGSVSTTGVTIGNALPVCTISVREISIGSGGITTLNSRTLTLGGDTTVKAAAAWTSSARLALLSGTAGTTFDTNGNDLVLNGAISGAGKLVKTGAGTLTLGGANSFTGSVEIAEGVVVTTRPYSLGADEVTVKLSGGQLQVNASTNGAIVQTAISIVLSDAYFSSAAITGDGALKTGTTITIEDLALATVAEAALQNQYSFQIATADTTIASSLTKGSFMFSEALRSDWRISDYTNGVLTIAAIPEPSVFGLLAGLGALALAGTRRRRKA